MKQFDKDSINCTSPLNSYISSLSMHDYNVKLANVMPYAGHNKDYTNTMVTAKRTMFKKKTVGFISKTTV